jgi:hypothetical protein
MASSSRDEEREERITMEIVVDCYGPEEQVMGWYCYLDENLTFPFQARCIEEVESSPLEAGETVKVVGMPSERACEHDMLVKIEFGGKTLAVPLSQLEAINGDEETVQAIGDWHYWVGQGYEF